MSPSPMRPRCINLYDDIDFVFNHRHDFKQPLLRRGRLLQRQGRADRLPAADQFRGRRGQPAADHRQGARRRRRPYPLQHGARLDREPHLAVPGRHLQEGACARAGRPRHRALGRGLFADVAGGRGAAPLRLAGRHADRSAQCLVPPAFQFRADAGALSRLQALVAAQLRRACRSRGSRRRLGGTQIDYADEHPLVRRMFAEALARHGTAPRAWTMVYAAELPNLPPKAA